MILPSLNCRDNNMYQLHQKYRSNTLKNRDSGIINVQGIFIMKILKYWYNNNVLNSNVIFELYLNIIYTNLKRENYPAKDFKMYLKIKNIFLLPVNFVYVTM